MLSRRLLAGAGLTGLLAVGFPAPLAAEVFATATRPGNFSFSTSSVDVPISTTGALQTGKFANAARQRFIVTYTAECAVNAPAGNSIAWLDLDIVVINEATKVETVLPPTEGTGDAFCSANGTAGFDGWAMHTVNAVGGAGLPAGNYRVKIRARLNAGATGGWLGDSSLILWR